MFSLTCARTNGWINNRDAGDLRRHRAHYDATVMVRPKPSRVVRWAAAVQQSSYERSAILGPLRYWWKTNAVITISSCQCHRRCFCDPGASHKQEFILTRGTWLSTAWIYNCKTGLELLVSLGGHIFEGRFWQQFWAIINIVRQTSKLKLHRFLLDRSIHKSNATLELYVYLTLKTRTPGYSFRTFWRYNWNGNVVIVDALKIRSHRLIHILTYYQKHPCANTRMHL